MQFLAEEASKGSGKVGLGCVDGEGQGAWVGGSWDQGAAPCQPKAQLHGVHCFPVMWRRVV